MSASYPHCLGSWGLSTRCLAPLSGLFGLFVVFRVTRVIFSIYKIVMALSTRHMRVPKYPGTQLEESRHKAPRVVKLLVARSTVLLGHKALWIVLLFVLQLLRLQSLNLRLYSMNHSRLQSRVQHGLRSRLLARNVPAGRRGGYAG